MKTPDDIIATLTVGGYAKHGEYLYDASEIIDAMKEYAKQWVQEAQRTAVAVTGVDDVPFVAGKSFKDLIDAIEKD